MLSFFRRIIYSRVGVIVTGVVLVLIALAFASGDVSSLRSQGLAALGGGGNTVLTVGKTAVSAPEFATRVDNEMQTYRQQQPTLTIQQFVAGGGFDATMTRLSNALALQQFGEQQGIVISKRAVDGQIASIPGLQGLNGEFDPNLFRGLLAERKLTEQGVRADIQRDMMATLLTAGLLSNRTAPQQLALPYANMSLERREGLIGFVPTKGVATGPAPTDAELQGYYNRNLARYTVPERRIVRFARVTSDVVRAQATPTDAEIARAYANDRAKYAATEKRTVSQVRTLDEASAQQLAARIKGGATAQAAATAAGLAATTQADVDKATYAQGTSPAAADAVFGAAKGSVVGPLKVTGGFVVSRVDEVKQIAGRSLAQVRPDIVAALTKTKSAEALTNLGGQIDDALGGGKSTFDEIVADKKLQAQATPPLLANGIDPDHPGQPDTTLAPLLTAAFAMAEGDEPQVVPAGADGSFAVVALGRIVPAAPRPLAQARDTVLRDLLSDRARTAARKVAADILARVQAGASMADAVAKAGVPLPPPHPLVAARDDIERAQGPQKAPLSLLFAMAPGTTKLLEAPGNGGWAIIRLNRIQPGDASKDPTRITGIRQALGGVLGREYAEQFARATQKAVGVTVNKAAVARTKAQLLGQGGPSAN